MKKIRVLYIASAMFLVGCAGAMSGWSKPGALNEQVKRDFAECRKRRQEWEQAGLPAG